MSTIVKPHPTEWVAGALVQWRNHPPQQLAHRRTGIDEIEYGPGWRLTDASGLSDPAGLSDDWKYLG